MSRNPRSGKTAKSEGPVQLSLFDDIVLPAAIEQAKEPTEPTGSESAENELREFLQAGHDQPVHVTFTNHRYSMLSVRSLAEGGLKVRINRAFAQADDETRKALIRFLKRPTPKVRAVIDDFILENHQQIESSAPAKKPGSLRTWNYHHDLGAILDRVSQEYGISADGIKIGWGQSVRRRKRRYIKFGSYDDEHRLIRMSPDLDRPGVPDFFVEFIVYHELLHALLPVEHGPSGRRKVHTKQFKKLEKKFARYREALEWEKVFLRKYL